MFDNPDWVHSLLKALLEKKLRFVEESLVGAKFDLIETGGGAGSDTVISPTMHEEFCLPYDRQIHDALHAAGHRSTYHTCGGMMHILDLIIQNGTDASETLSPPGTGGNITGPEKVRKRFAGKLAMIGGMDQVNVLTSGSPEKIAAETRGGYSRDSEKTAATSARPATTFSRPRSKTSRPSPGRPASAPIESEWLCLAVAHRLFPFQKMPGNTEKVKSEHERGGRSVRRQSAGMG